LTYIAYSTPSYLQKFFIQINEPRTCYTGNDCHTGGCSYASDDREKIPETKKYIIDYISDKCEEQGFGLYVITQK